MTSVTNVEDYFYGVIRVNFDLTEEEVTYVKATFPIPTFPDGESLFDIENENRGSQVKNLLVILNDYTVEQTQTGKPYLKLSFSNSICTISAKMWDNDGAVEQTIPLLDEYSVFSISGKVEEYKGFKSITLSKIKPSLEDIDAFSLIASTKQDLQNLTFELYAYLKELDDPFREIALKAMETFWNEFSIRPAAMRHHHAYLGGLLKHTVGLMRFTRYLLKRDDNHYQSVLKLILAVEKAHKQELWSDLQSENPGNTRQLVWKDTLDHLYDLFHQMAKVKDEVPNYSLIMCAIFYHDLGKMLEYQHAGKGIEEFKYLYPTAETSSLNNRKPTGITMDDLGVLVGHIPYGVLLIGKVIENENISISIEDIHHLNHCILAHHGKLEWGAAIRPKTIEGIMIHLVDFLDSRYERTEETK